METLAYRYTDIGKLTFPCGNLYSRLSPSQDLYPHRSEFRIFEELEDLVGEPKYNRKLAPLFNSLDNLELFGVPEVDILAHKIGTHQWRLLTSRKGKAVALCNVALSSNAFCVEKLPLSPKGQMKDTVSIEASNGESKISN